ncbi:solute carrier family 23 protein [Kocuria marina]|uniref:solute carrier family 23 protein n=1 Tax=Kocuria marina TaxID=223184 RepID=UPI003460E650
MAANGAEDTIFRNVCLAGATLLIITLLCTVRSAVISRLSILLGIVLGTLLALGMADFSKVGDGAFFAFPEPLAFGPPAGQGSVFTEAPPRFVPIASIEHLQNHLREGDTVKDGKLVDSEGNEIPCIIASGEVVPAPLDSKKSGTAGEH